jgi:hypothetical protein
MLTTVFNFAILAALAAADCSIGGSLAAIPSGGSPIHPNGNTNMCLDVQSNNQRDGTPVQVWECNGSAAQQWTFNRGSGQIKLTGTNYCIDASSCECLWRPSYHCYFFVTCSFY